MAFSGRSSRSLPIKRTVATLTAVSTDLNSGGMPPADQAAFNLCVLLEVFVHKSLIYQR